MRASGKAPEEVRPMTRRASLLIIIAAALLIIPLLSCRKAAVSDYAYAALPLTAVQLTDGFWAPRLETNRTVTIPFALDQSESTGRVKNFEIAGGLAEGEFCSKYPFDDSDVFKVIEGAAYSLLTHPDPALEKRIDGIIAKIAAAQEKDGYLYTARTINPAKPPVDWVGPERWSNLSMSHELYNLGHLYEAAVAHFQATGKKSLLKVALKSADLVESVFGPEKRRGAPGHQEIEIGLVKLYRKTGKKKYLDLGRYFLDERGNTKDRKSYGEYSQDHLPVADQAEAVGHAVRALYMYSGMADVSALTGNAAYLRALDRLWESVTGKKMYLTGGIGAAGSIEGFGPAYELPNDVAYCETCASIASILWNQRLFLLHGDSRYIDILERTLYNSFLSGVGMSGDLFFYPNPLESGGKHSRSPWFACACCPSNVTRFVPQIPGYFYAVGGDALYVNLFAAGEAETSVNGRKIRIRQETLYPWDGAVKLIVTPDAAGEFELAVRVPGWARGRPVPGDLYAYPGSEAESVEARLNGSGVPAETQQGYIRIRRTWNPGDTVEVVFPMPVRRALANPAVKADAGRVAVERGPLVFCAEWPDNGGQVSNLVLADGVELSSESRSELLGGVTVISGDAASLVEFRAGRPAVKLQQRILLIPYYAWAHRGKGEMMVWLAREDDKARPLAPASSEPPKTDGGRSR
ncbi:MAG: six-hairpin glycosidase [Candidatus Aminicenantes bacterium RBG_16_63_16]|nr:MAG: six-hairpin glycosidase [Candidatus Aminicenantes bacterium RBG_16_63_16]